MKNIFGLMVGIRRRNFWGPKDTQTFVANSTLPLDQINAMLENQQENMVTDLIYYSAYHMCNSHISHMI